MLSDVCVNSSEVTVTVLCGLFSVINVFEVYRRTCLPEEITRLRQELTSGASFCSVKLAFNFCQFLFAVRHTWSRVN